MACNPATGIRGDLTTSLTLLLGMLMAQCGFAQQNRDVDTSGFQTDFAETNDQWVMTNPSAWKWEDGRLRLSVKQSEYLPSVRSPRHIAWLSSTSDRRRQEESDAGDQRHNVSPAIESPVVVGPLNARHEQRDAAGRPHPGLQGLAHAVRQ